MFWPDDEALSAQTWWSEPAWVDGPTYGAVVAALRPALRAALLLGYQVHSIDLGIGKSTEPTEDWRSIRLDTLEVQDGKLRTENRTFPGLNIRLGVAEVVDLLETIEGTYAVDVEIPLFGSSEAAVAPEPPQSEDGPQESPQDEPAGADVPKDLLDGIAEFAELAVGLLTARIPTGSAIGPLLSEVSGGLVWMLDPMRWSGVRPETVEFLLPVRQEMATSPGPFLRGQIFGERAKHRWYGEWKYGPANLSYLLMIQGSALATGGNFYYLLGHSLQERGEAHRLVQRVRTRLTDKFSSPTWLDALGELVRLGVVGIGELIEPAEPPEPLEAIRGETAAEEPVTEVTLRVWGGEAEVVCRRETVFDDGGDEGLEHSLNWDYLPGDFSNRPAVAVVAGRGVSIQLVGLRMKDPPELERPWYDAEWWDLEIYRVQDDAEVPPVGSVLQSLLQLAAPVIPSPDVRGARTPFHDLLVKPKQCGTFLAYPPWSDPRPLSGGGTQTAVLVEITVDPTSGTAAYALDAHFYTRLYGAPVGGVHLCVWATEGVRITSNVSEFSETAPQRGNPSRLSQSYWASEWSLTAELWEVSPPKRLGHTWRTMLPSSKTGDDVWQSGTPPELAYDSSTQQASYAGLTLKPALHSYRQDGLGDSVPEILMDIGLGLVPFWGDLADIGEFLLILGTGRNRWGRRVTNFETVLAGVGACIPLVSGSLLNRLGTLLTGVPPTLTPDEMGRLFVRSAGDPTMPLDDAEAALSLPRTLTPTPRSSPARRAEANALVERLINENVPIGTAVEGLVDGRSTGWLTVADVITDSGDGFVLGPLQTAYLRFLRDHGGVSPHDFSDLYKSGP